MLGLRPYKSSDAKQILTWCKDEVTFRKWTSDRYPSFPIEVMRFRLPTAYRLCDFLRFMTVSAPHMTEIQKTQILPRLLHPSQWG